MPTGEPHHFSFLYDPKDPLPQHYRDRFAQAKPGQVVGENSNTYLPHPDCARRISEAMPNVKLVISLREPVGRAYSDWAMRLRQQVRLSDMHRFLDPDQAPDLWYLHKGMYHQQIVQWLDYFPREQILILLAEDYKTDAEGQFKKLCQFLEIDDTFVPPSLTKKVNTKDQRLVFPRLRKKLRAKHPAYRAFDDMLRCSAIKHLAQKFFGNNVKTDPLDEVTRAKLRDFYRNDIEQLGVLLGRDLGHWLKP